jgi:UDP-N-acetylmuramate: L-alanyl-gamma-D-glutamyl-meso-diaminopimelate ligase
MSIKLLEEAGLNPSFLVGGISADFGISSRYTDSEYFVIEADEYDTAFFDKRSKLIHYAPDILVINNIEFDHADIFKDIEAIYWQFHQLLRKMPAKATVIYNANDTNVQKIIDMGCWSKQVKVQDAKGFYLGEHELDYSKFDIYFNNEKALIAWNIIGEHNALNALSAYAVAKQIGLKDSVIEKAFAEFKGIKRRLEVLYKSDSITLYDDFAHHPTSIGLTLDAVRNKSPKAFVVAIIDPRSNTMRQGDNKDSLPDAILKADSVLLYDHELLKWNAKEFLGDNGSVEYMKKVEDFVDNIKNLVANKNQKLEIVMMGNGSFDGLREKLVEMLENK